MPDLNSIDPEQAVFLIHTLGKERSFWAYWPSFQHFQAGLFPQTYRMSQDAPEILRLRLADDYPQAVELEQSEIFKTHLYRRIKRAELPEAVQAQIREVLKQQRQHWQQRLREVGFEEQDLQNVQTLKRRYRQLLYQYHPDHGGEAQAFLQLQQLYERAYLYFSEA